MTGGAVSIDGEKQSDDRLICVTIEPGAVLQVGRRRFVRLY